MMMYASYFALSKHCMSSDVTTIHCGVHAETILCPDSVYIMSQVAHLTVQPDLARMSVIHEHICWLQQNTQPGPYEICFIFSQIPFFQFFCFTI